MSPAKPYRSTPGSAGLNLIANVKRLRAEQRLSLRRLSLALKEAGRPIIPISLSRLEQGLRRVDVDELCALAEVLGVTPQALLAPPDTGPAPELPGLTWLRGGAGIRRRHLEREPMALGRLLTPQELLEHLDGEGGTFSNRTLQHWRRIGKGPSFVRIGGHIRYRETDVEAWLDTNTVERGGKE